VTEHTDPTSQTDEQDAASWFGDVIHTYTRGQAIQDGVLVAVDDDLARSAGFRVPVALTATAWADAVAWDEETEGGRDGATGQDETGRLWDVLTMARLAAARAAGASRVDYDLMRVPPAGNSSTASLTTMSLHIGPGDSAEPVVTIMLPGED